MRKTIRIEDLYLALDNPRLTDSQNEAEELEKMVSEQGTKLLVLAEDIIEHGLNPLDTTAVYPSEKSKGKYIVAEGNRRVAVIKILNNPLLISTYDLSIYNKLSKLKLKYTDINEIDTWLFGNSADPALLHWIEIKHMGEQKGKGTSTWNSIQKERFDQKVRGESKLLDFWFELEKYNILDYDEIMEITKTNWERILRDIGIDFLGIHKSGSKLVLPMDDLIVFAEKMKCVHSKLANKTVAIVYDQEKIEAFFDQISEELYGKERSKNEQLSLPYKTQPIIDTNIKIDSTQKAEQNIGESTGNDGILNFNEVHSQREKSSTKDFFNGCRTIIPYSYALRSSNVRLNAIIRELKSLPVDEYPNSTGILLRILFELSAKLYLENLTETDKTVDDLQQVILFAANDLRKNNKINNNEHAALSKDIDTLRLLFNGYVHNTDSYPSAEALKSIFKAHKKFIEQCLK